MTHSRGPRDSRHATLRAAPRALVLASMLTLAACSAASPFASTSPALPDGIPTPSQAAVVVGEGGGYDAGTTLFAFSSNLAPASALERYEAQLTSAGFVAAGTDGAWRLFRHGQTLLAIQAGQSGPPTDLLLRLSAGGSAAGSGGNGETAGSGGSTGGLPGGGGTGPAAGGNAGRAGADRSTATPNPGGNVPGVGSATGPAQAGDAAAPTTTPNPGGNVPGAGNTSTNPTATSNPGGNVPGAGNTSTDTVTPGTAPTATPNPGGNVPGAGNRATPVPQPDPPHGKPDAPPGQATSMTRAAPPSGTLG